MKKDKVLLCPVCSSNSMYSVEKKPIQIKVTRLKNGFSGTSYDVEDYKGSGAKTNTGYRCGSCHTEWVSLGMLLVLAKKVSNNTRRKNVAE